MKAVNFGNADAAFGELAVFKYLIDEHLMTDLVIAGDLDWGNPELSLLNIATRKDLPILAAILTKGVNAITREEKKALRDKWLGSPQRQDALNLPEPVTHKTSIVVYRYLGSIFGGVIALIIVVWFVRGRPKQLSIRETLFLVSFVFACLIVSIGTFVTLLLEGEKKLEEIEARKYASLNLALELKQSSDELTRFARTFVLTQDSRFEEYYNAAIAIRDGQKPHPKNFTRSYWDQVTAGEVSLDDTGETYSIATKTVELGFSEQEQAKIAKAKEESDSLIDLEITAFNAAKGLFKDSDGKFTIKGAPNLVLARDLLHGRDYHQAKSRIMKPIDDFFIMLEWRIANELAEIRFRNQAIIWTITGLTAATILFAVFVFFLLNRKIVSPLSVLEEGAIAVGDGDYSYQVNVKSDDEIGALSKTFNLMADGIKERTSELSSAYGIISESINYASNIQRSILPNEGVFEDFTTDSFVIWEPRDRVGGDIYWCRPWGLGYLIICADCTGHGVPGAFMTLIATAALDRAQEAVVPGRAGQLISRMHQLVQMALKQHKEEGSSDDGLELGICYLDIEQSQMTFAGARFSLFTSGKDGIVETKGDKSGIGYRRFALNQQFTDHQIEINPDAQYYMSTDGILDQVGGEKRRMFGKKRFSELLLSIQDKPMDQQKSAIQQALLDYQGDETRRDDVSLIGFKV